MSTIDFHKVDAAFQRLAGDKSHLSDFDAALKKFRASLPELNESEAQYVASSLINQRSGVQSSAVNAGGVKNVHGFLIKAAVNS